MLEILDRITKGQGVIEDLELLEDLAIEIKQLFVRIGPVSTKSSSFNSQIFQRRVRSPYY